MFFWYTTTGWMMWNFLAGALLVGATLVAYDGSATFPGTDALLQITEQEGVTYFGVGAPYLLACAKAGLVPGRDLDLSALRGLGSTGSPLPPEGYQWVYEQVKSDLILGSFSGGTDLCTGFVGPCPLLPVRSGVIAGRCLGAKVEAFDPAGRSVVGEVGELVLTEPMPSMPVGFWNDPDRTRYSASYYADFPGVWRHGDWIKILPDGGCVIYGRSDATLNRGGVRMGTSEFYRVVEAFPEVADSLVVDTGQLGREGRLVLYVTLVPGQELGDDLAGRLRAALRAKLSPRHVPDAIHAVPGIPRTLSGKKLEVPVRKILQGTPVAEAADPDALANPDVLVHFAPGGRGPEPGMRASRGCARKPGVRDNLGGWQRKGPLLLPPARQTEHGYTGKPRRNFVTLRCSPGGRRAACSGPVLGGRSRARYESYICGWMQPRACRDRQRCRTMRTNLRTPCWIKRHSPWRQPPRDGGRRAAEAGPAEVRAERAAGATVGDLTDFLRAYYRHAAAEDLTAFGAERIAAVAARHAALAAKRPQGRALVHVADADEGTPGAAGAPAAVTALGPVRMVVDIVTDDMPFLVDSVTMELNRHRADINLILHPRLVVRRDVTGTLHGVGRQRERRHGGSRGDHRIVDPHRGRRAGGPRVPGRPGDGTAAGPR